MGPGKYLLDTDLHRGDGIPNLLLQQEYASSRGKILGVIQINVGFALLLKKNGAFAIGTASY